MSQARTVRAPEELQKAAEHLNYDFGVLLGALQALHNLQNPPEHLRVSYLFVTASMPVIQIALIESAVIHLRSLVHFSYPSPPIHDEDVLAIDFLPNWNTIRPAWPSALDDVKSRVATEVAHLSYRRLAITAEEAFRWPFLAVLTAVADIMKTFVEHAPKEWTGASADGTPAATGIGALYPRWPSKP